MSVTRTRRAVLGVVLACAVLSAAGCSSSKSGSTTTTPAATSASATGGSPSASASGSASKSSSASKSASGSASSSPSGSASASGVTSATITIKNFAFGPADLTVAPGAKITVVNQDSTTHTLTATGSKAFDTGDLAGGKSATITAPTTPGSYPYICSIHTYMKGTLTVK